MNSRLDELQAAILRVKLRQLDADNARRAAIAAPTMPASPACRSDAAGAARRARATSSTNMSCALAARDALARGAGGSAASARNIHYPVPVHLQPAYRGRVAVGPTGSRESERAAARC